jgi:predicted RNase H-like HicB family nuclease
MAGVIPALSDLTAEGSSYDEAVHNARHAAELGPDGASGDKSAFPTC